MTKGRLLARAVLATLLSPIVAGFAAALVFTIIMFLFMSESRQAADGTTENFFNIILYLWLAAAFFGALFTIAATLLSQIPLIILHRMRGRRALARHVAASAVLGVMLFWLLSPILTPFRNTGPVKWEDLWSLSVSVAAGGVLVGLLWDWLVLKPMFKGE